MRDSWQQREILELTSLVKDGTHGTHKDVDSGIPLLSAKDINNGKVSIPHDGRKISVKDFKQIHSNYCIQENDILITLVGSIGRLAIVQDYSNNFTLQRSVGILRFNEKLDKRYTYYYLASPEFQNNLMLSVNASAQGGVYLGTLSKLKIKYPPDIALQRKIAKILNTVDAVIEKTEAAIAKYKALKQGMMQDLFTRGIDPQTGKLRPGQKDAPELYKETELGWIPREWEVENFGDLVFGKGVYGINAAAVNYDPEKYAYLRITDISENGYFIPEGRKSVEHPEARNFLLSEGDIVFARTGNSTGKTYLYDEKDGKLVFAGFLIKFHPNPNKLLPGFIKFYTETYWYWNWVEIYSARTGQPGINGNEYGKLPLPTPQVAEQKLIVKKLNSINKKIESENKTLSKHQSLKKGLMQDLLTGKVEVEV